MSIQLVLAALIFVNAINQPRYGYMAAFDDKVAMLEQHRQPHLILIGGSNLAFGIDSEMLEAQIGMPTINAGLHGGLGMQIYLDLIQDYARAGDVVILAPEYPMLSSRLAAIRKCLQELYRHSPSSWKYCLKSESFQAKDFVDNLALQEIAYLLQTGLVVDTTARRQRKYKQATEPGFYSRLHFNEHGDFVGHHGLPQAEVLRDWHVTYRFDPGYYAVTTNAINDCARTLKSKGAKMYFSYCPIPEQMYTRSGDELENAHRYLKQHLEVPILHSPTMVRFPKSSFFDTSCHLSQQGKKARTQVVADSLQEHFSKIAVKPEREIVR